MLNFIFTDISDNEITIKNPVSLEVNMDENVPAHDLCATFLYCDVPELVSVTVTDEKNVLFVGVVDEQIRQCSAKGEFLTVIARSMAAKLLDNESVPISYTHPTKEIILKNHAKPFSVYSSDTDDCTYFGTQTVSKGYTNWQAIEDFSKNVYHAKPYVDALGLLSFKNDEKRDVTIFSNTSDGVRFQSFKECKKRCEEISQVKIKAVATDGYHMVVKNESACERKIQRERYLNAVFTNTPVVHAQNMIRKSVENAYTVTLKCVGCQLNTFMNNAVVRLSKAQCIDGLYVSSLRYSLSDDYDVTTVTLKRKESNYVVA